MCDCRFECPDDYHRLPPVSDDGTAFIEDLEDEDVELWLCKVPIDVSSASHQGLVRNNNNVIRSAVWDISYVMLSFSIDYN